jgi:hypothetical protein
MPYGSPSLNTVLQVPRGSPIVSRSQSKLGLGRRLTAFFIVTQRFLL